jgi:hypothetical protein
MWRYNIFQLHDGVTTSIPTENANPAREIIFRLRPNARRRMKTVIKLIGMEIATTRTDRIDRRNIISTRLARTAPINRLLMTRSTDCSI